MELRVSRLLGRVVLLLVSGILAVSVISGEVKEFAKGKKVSLFYRHHDCVVTYFHNGLVVNSTLDSQGEHYHRVTARLQVFGRLFVLDLTLNRQLFSGSYIERVFHSHGQSSERSHRAKVSDNCYYHGTLRHQPQSEAAVSTCHGLSGFVSDRRDTFHIEPVSERVVRVYRDRDQRQLSFRCGTENHDARLQAHKMVIGRHKRSVQPPYDSNRNTRYVELYLVNDYRTYERHGKSSAVIIRRSQDIANIVSSLYRKLNIYVALVGVEVWGSGDLISITTSPDRTMENFLRYRKERINPYHHNDNAQLITGVFFDHGVIGKAINGPICTHKFSGGVNMDYGGLVTQVATTVAHEMGHNFGMEHDNDTSCDCGDDKCIMAATSGRISPRRWSSCSHSALAEAFDLGMDYCLKNIPTSIYAGPICGNGFKEDGEECDCGLPQDCTNRCCNASSCKLYPRAQCATGRCCDLNQCKPKGASTLCREPMGECDLPEFCNGTSEYCPGNVFVQNGQHCKGGESYCYKGQCRTHTDQCKLLWGETGRSSDPICYQQLNMNDNKDGNCGYNWTTDRYKRCEREDVMCGLLHCVHLNEKLMFWRDNLAISMQASFLSRGPKSYVCRSTMLDVGLDMPDPGFVPDGAKCEDNKICIDHKCVALAKLRVKQCPGNCDGHGKCNSRGNCHCDIGYRPPLCDRPGFGGSLDSGPATNEYAKKNLLIALLVVFLLVIPLLILLVIAFLNRRRLWHWWKILPSFKYRVRSPSKKPPPQPPQPNPSVGQSRADFDPPRTNLISNPMLQHNSGTMERKPRVWNPGTGAGRTPPVVPPGQGRAPPVVPPERPTAPMRPSSLAKTNSSEGKMAAKKVRLSFPIQETEGPSPMPAAHRSANQANSSTVSKPESGKNIPQSPKSGGIVKRESFRGSEISDPVLICTTSRNSLVLADGNVDIIGPEARRSPTPNKPLAVAVKRSQSERPISRPDPLRLTGQTPVPGTTTLKKSESARSPTRLAADGGRSLSSGFALRPVPQIPCDDDDYDDDDNNDDTQPLYSNQTDGMGDLLDLINQELTDANIYTNLPIQETGPPSLPPRSTPAKVQQPSRSDSTTRAPSSTTVNSKPSILSTTRPTPSSAHKRDTDKPQTHSRNFPSQKPATGSSSWQQAGRNSANTAPSTKPSESAKNSSSDAAAAESRSSLGKPDVKLSVSDELRNRVLARAGKSAGQGSSGSGAAGQKPTPSGTSTAGQQKSGPGTAKSVTAADVHKPVKPAPPKSTSAGRAQGKGQGQRNLSDTTTSSSSTAAKPTATKRAPTKPAAPSSSGKVSATGADKFKATSKPTPAGGPSSRTSSGPRAEKVEGVGSKPGETAAPRSNVSSLAAKFATPSEDTGSKVVSRRVSDLDKSSSPASAKVTGGSSKPEVATRPLARTASSGGASRPALPPKPGDQGGGTLPRKPSSSSSGPPKRVQSYKI